MEFSHEQKVKILKYAYKGQVGTVLPREIGVARHMTLIKVGEKTLLCKEDEFELLSSS